LLIGSIITKCQENQNHQLNNHIITERLGLSDLHTAKHIKNAQSR
jgi:hypothetical protein